MADILVYTKDYCPYCTQTKQLLTIKGQEFKEIDVTNDENLQAEMIEKAGGRKTVPQIFINDQHVGGFDDISALEDRGELDKLLAG